MSATGPAVAVHLQDLNGDYSSRPMSMGDYIESGCCQAHASATYAVKDG
jgi:hypothetical protein